jgi:hypothetical protein
LQPPRRMRENAYVLILILILILVLARCDAIDRTAMTAHAGLTGRSAGPRSFNARVAQPARVYDYWLGGKGNFRAIHMSNA